MPKDLHSARSFPQPRPEEQATERAFDDYELTLLDDLEPKLADYFSPEDVPHFDLTSVDPGQGVLPFAEDQDAQPERNHAAG